ncbi:hypothetical protein [Alteromonas sp. a30]|nr:hypothetical protein [Alteromonas sp. a30]MCY7297136.1 hypothetical protein [Alteromonas sp. a30]
MAVLHMQKKRLMKSAGAAWGELRSDGSFVCAQRFDATEPLFLVAWC